MEPGRILKTPAPVMAAVRYTKAAFMLVFITLSYWLVGVPEENYRITKGNAWCDLRRYGCAIRNYEKALKEKEIPMVRAAVGWCYAQLGMNDSCVAHYRKAYQRSKSTEIALGLAFAEHSAGNWDESRQVLKEITAAASTDYERYASDIERLRQMVDLNA